MKPLFFLYLLALMCRNMCRAGDGRRNMSCPTISIVKVLSRMMIVSNVDPVACPNSA